MPPVLEVGVQDPREEGEDVRKMSPALLRGTGLPGTEQRSGLGNPQCSKEAKEGKSRGVPNTGRLLNKMEGKHRQ